MGDERHLAGNDCCQAVIHDLEVEALQVGDVAGDVEGHDLASAARKEFVAAGEPFKDRAALQRAVLVPDDVRVCFKLWPAFRHLRRERCFRAFGSADAGRGSKREASGRSSSKAGAPITLSHRLLDEMADDANTISPRAHSVANI